MYHRFPFGTSLFACAISAATVVMAPVANAQDTQPATESQPASDLPEAEKILDMVIKAMGGEDALQKIESLVVKAEMNNPMGMKMMMESYWSKPDKAKLIQSAQGMEVVMATNGTLAWTKNPMTGGYQLLGEDEADGIVEQARMQLMLLHNREELEENKIKTVAMEEFNGEKSYKLELPAELAAPEQAGAQSYLYVAEESHLPAGMSISQNGPRGNMTVTMAFKQWKEIGDVKFYHQVVISQMGMEMVMDYTEIKVNEKLPDDTFAVPAEVQSMADQQNSKEPATMPEGDG